MPASWKGAGAGSQSGAKPGSSAVPLTRSAIPADSTTAGEEEMAAVSGGRTQYGRPVRTPLRLCPLDALEPPPALEQEDDGAGAGAGGAGGAGSPGCRPGADGGAPL
jgi:hypothetical protein